ncbi:MAG: AMP-binding protein [Myxococcota bacterium]
MVLDRARRLLQQLQNAREDPPHRRVQRFVRTGLRTGLIRKPTGNPLDVARVAWEQGLGVRSMHALHAASEPDRPAAVDRRRTLSYAQLNAELDAFASALVVELGARRGQPVTMLMDNRVEYLVAWFALSRLAVTCAHASRYSTAEELAPLLAGSGSRIVIVSDATRAVADAAAASHPELALQIVHVTDDGAPPPPGAADYHALVEAHRGRAAPRAPRDAGSNSVVYTSGTTGRPKGAVRDLKSVGVKELFEILDRLPLHCGDRHLVVAPLYHSAAQAFVLINAALANTIILEEKFDAQTTLRRMSEEGIHNLFLVPTMLHRILDLPAEAFARHPTPELHAIVSGAALFPTALRHAAMERFGAAKIFDFYGATELGWVTLIDGTEMKGRPGSVGRAIPGQEIGVFGEDGKRVPTGEVGMVYTRSAQMMHGYLADQDATDRTRLSLSDDWATVDDLGYLDGDGYLFVTGRARDMVISGGVNVYPVEVENALALHPGIREVAVIGLPHPEWGEMLTAVVVPEGEFDPEEATQWARTRLAPYKVPRRWETMELLPRNPTGKILKRELRDQLA